MKKLYKIIILLVLSSPSVAFVTVGSSPGSGTCDHSTIQSAIDSGEYEVRILNNQTFNQNLFIFNEVHLKGGYPNCNAAQADQPLGSNTTISGSQILGAAVVFIDYNDSSNVTKLERLILRDATDTNLTDGGVGLYIGNSNGIIELINTNITQNTAENGGGIYSSNPSGVLNIFLNNSYVFGNTASERGGGIFCGNANTNVNIQYDSGIFENQADFGGGIAAVNGCTVVVSTGRDKRISDLFIGIIGNLAFTDGGGIFADLAAEIQFEGNNYGFGGLFGNNTYPATIAENQAFRYGGGIAAIRGSTVDMVDTLVWSNTASERGGAIYLDDAANLEISTSSYNRCWDQSSCSLMANNKASFGGAVYQQNNSTAIINNTHLYGHRADFGAVIYSREDTTAGSMTMLYNSMIYHNGDDGSGVFTDTHLIRAFEDVSIQVIHSTIANNDISDTSGILAASTGASFEVKNSIVHNPDHNVYADQGSNTMDAACLLVNETVSISGSEIHDQDPDFMAPVAGNFRIDAESFAQDMCAQISGFNIDIDQEDRGYDADFINLSGTYDAGADESYRSDVIFDSGFE